MRKIAVSGGTGYVGRFIVDHLLTNGQDIVVLGRQAPKAGLFSAAVEHRPFALSDTAIDSSLLADCDVLIHAAFYHVAGKYRGGEGDDPETFRHLNHDGSMALFEAAKAAGVKRTIFVSSRAVYGAQEAGSVLTEDTMPCPDTLYGQIKHETERGLAALEDKDFLPIIVRATGIYGVSIGSRDHKWQALFDAFENSEPIKPRIGTEVHGADFANAIGILIALDALSLKKQRIFNVSDILLDRRKLLESYAKIRKLQDVKLPEPSSQASFNPMDCRRLRNLGWAPRGRLDLSQIVDAFG